ncbi:MAG: hypothetical protein HC779_03215 [Phyllobacteriaceae bacterium]|nr:hypothetical protein [Phyllobacteriaceae bacterium]
MSELIMSSHFSSLIERGRVDPSDVMALRQSTFADGVVCRDEAIGMFAVHTNCTVKCGEWDEFFVEALSDFLVMNVEPAGYVSEKQAAWLVSAIARNGSVATRAELELLITVLEKSQRSPERLSAFALAQVADAVIDHRGPLSGNHRRDRVISAADVAMIRRILFAFGGENAVGISKAEAEVLFRLNDLSIEAENDPAWNDLFVKAIANCMMAVSHYTVPLRSEALRREQWLDNHHESRSFFNRMLADGLKGVLKAYLDQSDVESAYALRNAARAAEADEAAAISADEARWLAGRINADGYIRANEKALLTMMKAQSPRVHPDLQPLLDRVA